MQLACFAHAPDIRGFQPRINMIEFQSYTSDLENIRDPVRSYSRDGSSTDIWGFQPRINMIEFQSYASDVENIRDP